MFCKSCGRALAENLRFCDNCGTDVNGGGTVAAIPLAQQLRSEVKARSLDAWQGVKLFAKSPVGGLPESFAMFDDRRAIQVGIVFAIVYEIALLLGAFIFRSKAAGLLGGLLPIGELTAAQMFKVLFLGLVPFASLIGACALARAIFHGKGRFAGDVYTAGAVIRLRTEWIIRNRSVLFGARAWRWLCFPSIGPLGAFEHAAGRGSECVNLIVDTVSVSVYSRRSGRRLQK